MTEDVERAHFGIYGITYSYGRARVLDEVSYEAARGEFLTLIGPNGCGKSTLLKAAAGILPLGRSGAGQVRLGGRDFLALPPAARARQIAYVAADLRAEFPMTAEEAVGLGRSCQGDGLLRGASGEDREAVRWAMEKCMCWALRERDLHTLSGGERQLVALARALSQGARVLFLDEALSRMDLHHQAATGRMLRGLCGEGYLVVLVSHDINLASEWADTALLLKAGKRVAHGPIREVLTMEVFRELYPGAGLQVGSNPSTGAPKIFFGADQK